MFPGMYLVTPEVSEKASKRLFFPCFFPFHVDRRNNIERTHKDSSMFWFKEIKDQGDLVQPGFIPGVKRCSSICIVHPV